MSELTLLQLSPQPGQLVLSPSGHLRLGKCTNMQFWYPFGWSSLPHLSSIGGGSLLQAHIQILQLPVQCSYTCSDLSICKRTNSQLWPAPNPPLPRLPAPEFDGINKDTFFPAWPLYFLVLLGIFFNFQEMWRRMEDGHDSIEATWANI